MKQKSGIKRTLRRLELRDDLYAESGELDEYKDGFTISQIDANQDAVEFTNGVVLKAGEATGDVNERDIRRIQIRETVKAHLDKERQLHTQASRCCRSSSSTRWLSTETTTSRTRRASTPACSRSSTSF